VFGDLLIIMKTNWGDILYLLAMLAFFIISSIVKSKKKNAAPPVPEPEEDYFPDTPSADPFAGIFDDDEEYEQPPEPVRVETKPVVNTPPPSPVKEKVGIITDNSGSFVYNEDHESGSFWDEEEFDLRRAVVFSEILKRPEI
jgi:hypothetical protein